jgi:MFS family permease
LGNRSDEEFALNVRHRLAVTFDRCSFRRHRAAADHGRGLVCLSGHRRGVAGPAAARASEAWSLLSLRFVASPPVSAAILLLGRALLGGAESLIITGGVSWGLALVGPANAGRVIAWVGMAMFAALALGAPVGTSLYALGGFATIAIATTLVPLAAIALVALLAAVPAQRGARASLLKVTRAVWMPGFGSALSSIGLGVMIAFSSLLAAERHWSSVWLFFSVFAEVPCRGSPSPGSCP